jgi:hypothetical protein
MKDPRAVVLEYIRNEAARDHIGLWEILRLTKKHLSPTSSSDASEKVFDIIRQMLSYGFLAGVSRGRDFERWPDQSMESVLRRIESEWLELGRDPNPGDVVWFDLPNGGKLAPGGAPMMACRASTSQDPAHA